MKKVISALLYKIYKDNLKSVVISSLFFIININFIFFLVGNQMYDSMGRVALVKISEMMASVNLLSFMIILYNIFINQIIRRDVNQKIVVSYLMCPISIREIWMSYSILCFVTCFLQYALTVMTCAFLYKIKFDINILYYFKDIVYVLPYILLVIVLAFVLTYVVLFNANAGIVNILPIAGFFLLFYANKINQRSPFFIGGVLAASVLILFFLYFRAGKMNNEKFFLKTMGG